MCEMKVINRLHSRLPSPSLTTTTTTTNKTSGTPPTGLLLSTNRCRRSQEDCILVYNASGVRSRILRKKRRVGWFRRRRNLLQAATPLDDRRRTTERARHVTSSCVSFRSCCFLTVSASTATCSNDGIHHGLCLFQR